MKKAKNELVLYEGKVEKIKESEYPVVISETVSNIIELKSNIVELDKKVKSAERKAKKLKNEAGKLKTEKKGIKTISKDVKKDAIEQMQEAQRCNADATMELSKAQVALAEYQKKLTNVTEFLFSLCGQSLAANRIAIKHLKAELKNVTDENSAKFAEEDILKLINDLQQQQDILAKQDDLNKKTTHNKEEIENLIETTEQQAKEISVLKQQMKIVFVVSLASFAISGVALILSIIL